MAAEHIRISAAMLPEAEQLEMVLGALARTWEIVLAEGVPAEIALAGLLKFTEQKSSCERMN
jgi:hypothetical protein